MTTRASDSPPHRDDHASAFHLSKTSVSTSSTARASSHSPAPAGPVFSSVLNTVLHQLTPSALPVFAPTGALVQKILQFSRTGRSGYNIDAELTGGLPVSFGGQRYSSRSNAQRQLEQLVIVTPGPGSPTSLSDGITAGSFPAMPLITWTEGHWIIEVSASPGRPISTLRAPSMQLAALLHQKLLPDTTFAVLNWAEGANGQDSIDLSWQRGRDSYWVNESHDGNMSAAVSLAAAMRQIPARQ